MAASANYTPISTASSICFGPISPFPSSSSPSRLPPQFFVFPKPTAISASSSSADNSPLLNKLPRTRMLRSFIVAAAAAAAEGEGEETLVPEGEPGGDEEASSTPPPATDTTDQTVSVTVSPSDVLTMFFQADGTMNETAIPTVTKALEEIEGIADLRVRVLEGIASVELTKQTTVQATGVASSLVETIQSKGFKLQTLNLSFQDEEDFI